MTALKCTTHFGLSLIRQFRSSNIPAQTSGARAVMLHPRNPREHAFASVAVPCPGHFIIASAIFHRKSITPEIKSITPIEDEYQERQLFVVGMDGIHDEKGPKK